MVNWLKLWWSAFRFALTYKPMSGADDDPPADDPPKDDPPKDDPPKEDPPKDDDTDDDDDSDEPPEAKEEPNWKQIARRNENRLKKEKRERERLEKEAKARDEENKSEQEKAIEKARQEGEQSAAEKAKAERQQDRLENSVIRMAAKGVRVGEGDEAKTVRFADADDAMMHVQRAVKNGDVDMEELFTEQGAVNSDIVADTLSDILASKSYLAAGEKKDDGKPEPPKGGADGGKGDDAKADLESMSVEDHLGRIRKGDAGTATIRELD